MLTFASIGIALRGIAAAIPKRLLFAAAGVVAAIAAFWVTYHLGASHGRQQGREAALEQSLLILKQKAKTDAEIRDMSDADLCRALGGSLSDGVCN